MIRVDIAFEANGTLAQDRRGRKAAIRRLDAATGARDKGFKLVD